MCLSLRKTEKVRIRFVAAMTKMACWMNEPVPSMPAAEGKVARTAEASPRGAIPIMISRSKVVCFLPNHPTIRMDRYRVRYTSATIPQETRTIGRVNPSTLNSIPR